MCTTGTGATHTGFARGADMPALPTVIRVSLRVGARVATAIRSIARTAGAVTLLSAIGADAGAVLTGFIRATSMATGTAVGMIGVEIGAGTVTLGFARWTHTLSTGTDLVGAADMATRTTIVGIAAQVRAGAMTAAATTALATRVAANAIRFAVCQRGPDASQTQQTSKGSGNGFKGLTARGCCGQGFGQVIEY